MQAQRRSTSGAHRSSSTGKIWTRSSASTPESGARRRMSNNDQTASYLDLASSTYGLLVETAANANHRLLEHLKATYEIVSRPYTSTAVESTYRENLDRAGQLVELNVAAAQKTGSELASLADKLAKNASQWQETYVETMRGLFRTGLS